MIKLNNKSSEILEEFWKDYKETIRFRLFSWINHHKKEIVRAPKKRFDENGYINIPEIRKVNINGNKYRCAIKAGFMKDCPKFVTTTYIILEDKTVILLPSEEQQDYLIILEKRFFERYSTLYKLSSLPIDEVIDSFMRLEKEFYLTYHDTKSNEYNAEVRFEVDGLFGIGWYENKVIKVKTLVTPAELLEWEKAYKLKKDLNPVEIYIENKERNKIFNTIYYNPEKETEKLKKQQMADAWDLYERGKL
jgi:hypothetical protein